MASPVKFAKHQTLSKNQSKGNTPKLILQSQHHPNTKDRKEQYQKIKLQINIPGAHRCKNSQKILADQNQPHIKRNIHHD